MALAPNITFHLTTAPYDIAPNVNLVQTKDDDDIVLPVLAGEYSNPIQLRVYNNFSNNPSTRDALNCQITTYDDVGSHTVLKVPVAQAWLLVSETMFGNLSSPIGTAISLDEVPTGGSANPYTVPLGSAGTSTPTIESSAGFVQFSMRVNPPRTAVGAVYVFAVALDYTYVP